MNGRRRGRGRDHLRVRERVLRVGTVDQHTKVGGPLSRWNGAIAATRVAAARLTRVGARLLPRSCERRLGITLRGHQRRHAGLDVDGRHMGERRDEHLGARAQRTDGRQVGAREFGGRRAQ